MSDGAQPIGQMASKRPLCFLFLVALTFSLLYGRCNRTLNASISLFSPLFGLGCNRRGWLLTAVFNASEYGEF